MRIKIDKEITYDDQQKIIKEVDHYAKLKLSIKTLSSIMKHCCSVDILDTQQVNTVRITLGISEAYVYNKTGSLDCYLIDGQTGKILYKTKRPYKSEWREDVTTEYFHLKEFKARQKNK